MRLTRGDHPSSGGSARAAFFDVDRTLIRGPALELVFARELIRSGELGVGALLGLLREGTRILVNRSGSVIESNKGYLKGRNARRVEGIAREVAERVAIERVKPEVRRRLEEHRSKGDRVILVSAELSILVRPLGEVLGADRFAGADLEVRRGRYTGRLSSTQPLGLRKATVLREIAAEEGLDLKNCTAYGDWFSDRHALALVGHAIAVDPEPALLAYARLRRWEILWTDRKSTH